MARLEDHRSSCLTSTSGLSTSSATLCSAATIYAPSRHSAGLSESIPALSPVDDGMMRFPKEGLNCSHALAHGPKLQRPGPMHDRNVESVNASTAMSEQTALIVSQQLYMKTR